jgi:uncharacterized tellurite resistance protein B-like protein
MKKRKIHWFVHVFFILCIFICLINLAGSPEEQLINKKNSNVNLRSGPGTKFGVVGKIVPNGVIPLIDDGKTWAKIEWNGKEAYVYSNLLEKKEESKSGTVFILVVLIAFYFWILRRRTKEIDNLITKKTKENDDSISISIKYGSGSYDSKIQDIDSSKLWVTIDQSVDVQKIKINKGNVYVGKTLRSVQNEYQTEAALINPSLKVDISQPDYEGQTMGYWPSYSEIDPRARSAYLKWLAGSRSEESANIGYVFLYFYGIERRLLIDADSSSVTKTEIESLISEVKRLLAVYGNNGSFNGYASNFVDFILIKYFPEKVNEFEINQNRSYDIAPLIKWRLAKYTVDEKPIPGELAYHWLNADPDIRLRVPAHRCENEFKNLFLIRYKEKYGEGIKIKPNKTKLTFNYRPASPSLNSLDFSINAPDGYPDVTKASGNIKKIRSIAEECVDELDSYSRYLGSKNAKPGSIEAEALLPQPLLMDSDNPEILNLKNWLVKATNDFNLISAKDLLKFWHYDEKNSISKKEAENISGLLEKLGYGIEPDIRYHGMKIDSQGTIVLFKAGNSKFVQPDESFFSMSLLLRLGAIVAHADGTFCDQEKSYFSKLIDQQIHLKSEQKFRLSAYLEWLLHTPPNMAGLKNRFSALDQDQKKNIAEIMLQTANADGVIDPEEIKQLEKIYKMLGLATESVIEHLHSYKAANREPVTIQKANAGKTEYTIPKEPVGEKEGFVLDIQKIGLIEKDTKEIQSILKPIFSDEEQSSEIELHHPKQVESDIQGLSTKHAELFHKLISQKQWSRDELSIICKDLELMVDGALETLNEFALEKVGEPLIEEYDGIFNIELETTREVLNEKN